MLFVAANVGAVAQNVATSPPSQAQVRRWPGGTERVEGSMDDAQRKEVGARVRQARNDRGWSQGRLAEEAGVTENTVLSIEQGRRQTQAAKLRAVLDALGMPAPIDDALSLDGVPEDARIFLKVAAQRLKVLDETERARVLARAYPALLVTDE